MNARLIALVISAALTLTACGGAGFGHLLGIPAIPTASPAPTIQVSPTSITIAGAGGTATITASENSASPYFSAQSTDTTIATVAQGSSANAFVVTGVKNGKCSILISDAYGSTTTVPVTVQ